MIVLTGGLDLINGLITYATDTALTGILSTIVVALVGSLGFLVKAMSDRIDKKDAVIVEIGAASTRALTESSAVLQQVLVRLSVVEAPK